MSAGVQALWKAAESRSGHLRDGKCIERAWLGTNGSILSGGGAPKSEFRLKYGETGSQNGNSGQAIHPGVRPSLALGRNNSGP